MARALAVVSAAALLPLLAARPAAASTITFTLDCSMTALATCGAPTGSFGTITLADDTTNSNWVDVDVDLTSPSGRIINKLFLNYDGAFPLPSGYGFTAGGNTVVASPDGEDNGVYGVAFDIAVVSSTNPFTTVLKLQRNSHPDINLDASDFDVTDKNGLLYGAVNYSLDGPQEGALVSDHGAPVPEPGTLGLAALGLIGLARRVRTRRAR